MDENTESKVSDLDEAKAADVADRESKVTDLDVEPPAELDFVCPRCQQPVAHRFYGPCPECVQQLRSELKGDAVDVVAPEYEPKMNVTPNAVALKED